MYHLYLIYSAEYDRLYIGHTNNLERRSDEHNRGKSIYTRKFRPWQLLAYKSFETRGDAVREERRIKRLKNRAFILKAFGLEA